MASPFPGLDPYLEQFWGDVHQSFITYARDQLQGVLPGDLRARVEERVLVEEPGGLERKIVPDIRVVERGRWRGRIKVAKQAGAAVAEPLLIRPPDEPTTEGYIEIIDLPSGRCVVTMIEVLSPTNKLPGQGRDLYLKKQKECTNGLVNLVEIDLLRAGLWTVSVPEAHVPASHRTSCHVCTYRAGESWHWEFYPLPLRERLPVIKIPLRPTDKDVPLDLQALIEQCYRNGGYDDDIDYQAEPDPPLDPADARWADGLLRKQRRRQGTGRGGRRPRRPSP